jgi:hypothetical protein
MQGAVRRAPTARHQSGSARFPSRALGRPLVLSPWARRWRSGSPSSLRVLSRVPPRQKAGHYRPACFRWEPWQLDGSKWGQRNPPRALEGPGRPETALSSYVATPRQGMLRAQLWRGMLVPVWAGRWGSNSRPGRRRLGRSRPPAPSVLPRLAPGRTGLQPHTRRPEGSFSRQGGEHRRHIATEGSWSAGERKPADAGTRTLHGFTSLPELVTAIHATEARLPARRGTPVNG